MSENKFTAAQAAWMRELNAEAVRRNIDPTYLPDRDIERGENCFTADYEGGLTPGQVLDQPHWKKCVLKK